MKILSFEWLLKDFNESGSSKRLFDSDKNSRDMRLFRGPVAIFPVNRFLETSSTCRDDKFPKQSGSEPSSLFPERSNSSTFFNPSKPVELVYL